MMNFLYVFGTKFESTWVRAKNRVFASGFAPEKMTQ